MTTFSNRNDKSYGTFDYSEISDPFSMYSWGRNFGLDFQYWNLGKCF